MAARLWLVGLAVFAACNFSGCQHCCKRSACPPPTLGPPGPVGSPNLPPQNLPPTTGLKPEILLPSPEPPRATTSAVPLPTRSAVVLGEPEFGPAAPEPKQPVVTPPPAPAGDDAAALPTAIASFAQVKEGVSNGLRPQHLDGIDWLKTKGYKNVVFLRSGKEDDSSDRKQFENRGLTYQSLIVAPDTIRPALVTEFNRLINDAGSRPMFVYDLDGVRAGIMWYLYFRTSETLNDDQARLLASRYGLKDKADGEQTQLWTAVQKYLSERNPSSDR